MNRKIRVLRSITSILIVAVAAVMIIASSGPFSPQLQASTPTATLPPPEISIEKSSNAGEAIETGQRIQFLIVVTNSGAGPAIDVAVKDDYDQEIFPTIDILPGDEESVHNDGSIITWQLGDMAPGDTISLEYEATSTEVIPPETLETSSTAIVFAADVEQVKVSLTHKVRVSSIAVERQHDLIEGEGEIGPGATVRYTIRYSNNGTENIQNVIIEEDLVILGESFHEMVVQEVKDISAEGEQSDDGVLRWNIGTVESGTSGEVSYGVTYFVAIALGTFEVQNEATIRADGLDPRKASSVLTMQTPLFSLSREHDDLNGGDIEPGDTLKFGITIINSGEVAASNVVIKEDYDESIVAEIEGIENGGQQGDGIITWNFTEIQPDEEMVLRYTVKVKSDFTEATEATNLSSVLYRGEEISRAQVILIVLPPTVDVSDDQQGIFQVGDTVTLALLLGMIFLFSLFAVTYLMNRAIEKDLLKDDNYRQSFRDIVELIASIFIVSAVLILALGRGIAQDGAVGIIAGVAGYMLGRRMR